MSQVEEIPAYPADKRVPQEIVQLRNKAPHYLRNMAAMNLIPSLEGITILSPTESVRSAVYLDADSHVIKITLTDQADNVSAIRSWQSGGVNAPTVQSYGTLQEDGDTQTAHFIIMDYVPCITEGTHIDGYPFLDANHTEQVVFEYGQSAGSELYKMHTAPIGTDVCKAKLPENNVVLPKLVETSMPVLEKFGVSTDDLNGYKREVSTFDFGGNGVWVHNDYAPQNLPVHTIDPLTVTVIDPNAIVAHPNWDFATATNRLLWIREQYKRYPTDINKFKLEREEWYYAGLSAGYLEKMKVDERNLYLHQIAQLIWKVASTGTDEVYQTVASLNKIFNLKLGLLNDLLVQYK